MKKTILLFISCVIISFSYGQEFLGIKVGGKKQVVIDAFKSKGFKVSPSSNINKDDVIRLYGNTGGKNLEVAVVCTPKSKIVWKFSVYLPEQTSWYSLKSDYEGYLNLLKNKYGEPESEYSFFSSPYEDGDGYEMTAVGNEKCTYSAYWSSQIGISIKISKFKQINISYENAVNSALDDKERAELDKTIF
jgi:hypothetical protein